MASIKKEMQITVTRNDGSVYQVLRSYLQSSQKEIIDQEVHLPPLASPLWVPLWDPATWTGFPVTAFQFLAILCEIDGGDTSTYAAEFCYVAETVNEADANEELHSNKLFVGQEYERQSNVAYYNHGAEVDTNAALDVIDKLQAINPQVDTGKPNVVLRLLMLDNS